MLFIYGALPVGGIETFFIRVAKERLKNDLPTSILLLSRPEQSDQALLAEMKRYASVLFVEDVFLYVSTITRLFPLLLPINTSSLREIFNKVYQIHVFHGMHALLAYRLNKNLNLNLPVTVGFYHYIKYIWGKDDVALHEKISRRFIFEYLPKQSLLFFAEENRRLYTERKKMDFSRSNIFRLGVVEKKSPSLSGKINKKLRIISIGRLVEFKSYNIYMLNVVSSIIQKGREVEFDIYGDGPMKDEIVRKIQRLGLCDSVSVKGTLDYLKFDETVTQYDIFIGSGSSIIQAASVGVPSIVGIDNVSDPETYGYFCDVHQYEFNQKGLDMPLISVATLVQNYVDMDEQERLNLKQAHIESASNFSMYACSRSFDNLKTIQMPSQPFVFNPWLYEMSRMLDRLNIKYNKNHPFNTRHEDFKMEVR